MILLIFYFFALFPFDYTVQHKKRVSIHSLAAGYLNVLRTTNILFFFFFFIASPEANSVPACFAKYRELFCSESPERLLYIQNSCVFSIATRAEHQACVPTFR